MLSRCKLNQLLKCKLKLNPWAWTLTCIKLDLEKRLFLRLISRPIWTSSSKLRWTLNSSLELMSNKKLNSWETSSTLLSADSKIAETNLPKPNLNNQPLPKLILENTLKILRTGDLVSETLFQLSATKTESQHHPPEPSSNWLLSNQPLPKLIPEKKLKILRTGLPVSETPSQLSPSKMVCQHHLPELSSNSQPIRRKEWPPTPPSKSLPTSIKKKPTNSSSHTPKPTAAKTKNQSECRNQMKKTLLKKNLLIYTIDESMNDGKLSYIR